MNSRGRMGLLLLSFLLVAASIPVGISESDGPLTIGDPLLSSRQPDSYLHSVVRSFEPTMAVLIAVVLYLIFLRKKLLPLFHFRYADLMIFKLRHRQFLMPIKFTSTFVGFRIDLFR
ncbi:hypothetical protein [Paenibacillus sp. SAFN-117]|uniref:hypothetical protein n=1 Tax=Paenibacillus sp. SAFN-117 TaxID=3436860 RepID=UPI003F7D140A